MSINKNNEKFEKSEKNNPLSTAGLGIACIVCSYLLAYNLDFFVYNWISKSLIIFMVLIAIGGCFVPTVNYYFKTNKSLMNISVGILIIPANAMWYILFPNLFLKIMLGISLFISIFFLATGFMQVILKYYKEETTAKERTTKVSLMIIAEIIALAFSILQIIFLFK